MTDYKSIKYNISGADLTGIPTSAITSGTLADARISASSVTAHVNLTPVRQDVLTLALKQAVQENSTKYNLPNSAIVKFEADADFNLAGSTTIARNASEYLSTYNIAYANSSTAIDWYNPTTTGVAGSNYKVYKYHFSNSTYDQTWYEVSSTGDAAHSATKYADVDEAIDNGGSSYGTIGNVRFSSTTGGYEGNPNYIIYDFLETKHFGGTLRFFNANSWAKQATGKITYSTDNSTYTDLDLSSATHDSVLYSNNNTAGGVWSNMGSDGTFTTSDHAHNNQGNAPYGSVAKITGIPDFNARYIKHEVTSRHSNPFGGHNMGTGGFDMYDYKLTVSTPATGTALGTTNVPTSAVTDVSGVMLLKDAYGSTTLGTDVKAYFTADNSNWTEATSYADAGTFSTGIKMIKLGKATCTSGSDVRWKIVWANQVASSKEAQIYGIGLNY